MRASREVVSPFTNSKEEKEGNILRWPAARVWRKREKGITEFHVFPSLSSE